MSSEIPSIKAAVAECKNISHSSTKHLWALRRYVWASEDKIIALRAVEVAEGVRIGVKNSEDVEQSRLSVVDAETNRLLGYVTLPHRIDVPKSQTNNKPCQK